MTVHSTEKDGYVTIIIEPDDDFRYSVNETDDGLNFVCRENGETREIFFENEWFDLTNDKLRKDIVSHDVTKLTRLVLPRKTTLADEHGYLLLQTFFVTEEDGVLLFSDIFEETWLPDTEEHFEKYHTIRAVKNGRVYYGAKNVDILLGLMAGLHEATELKDLLDDSDF